MTSKIFMVNPNVAPAVVYPSPNEWPITYIGITGITNSLQATITAPSHGITLSPTASTPGVDFTQVKGMFQINGKFAYVTRVIDVNNFVVNLDTSMFYSYKSGGFANLIAGSSPIDPLTNTFDQGN